METNLISEVAFDKAAVTEPKVYKFVLTGGPCSGKTTAMERIPNFLRERGYRVFTVPEAATMLFVNGASVDDFAKDECSYAFQQYVIHTQLSLEDSTVNYAKSTGQTCAVLCDRGAMDGSAYISAEAFERLLAEVNLDYVSARDNRYDAVFHLVTAADGAETFYTLENNGARSESPAEARAVDRRTQQVWTGHPRHVIIDNGSNKSFEQKLEELTNAIALHCGLPSLKRRAHKFQLLNPPVIQSLPNVQIFDVEKIILLTPVYDNNKANGIVADAESGAAIAGSGGREIKRFIRRRSQGRQSSYGLTVVKQLVSGAVVELKQVISAKMYAMLASTAADKRRSVIHQRRYCFLWEKQSFHIHEYLSPRPTSGLWLLFCQSADGVILPPFLQCGPEIPDGDDSFSSHALAMIEDEGGVGASVGDVAVAGK